MINAIVSFWQTRESLSVHVFSPDDVILHVSAAEGELQELWSSLSPFLKNKAHNYYRRHQLTIFKVSNKTAKNVGTASLM